MEILYTAVATATGAGRAGDVHSSDGVIDEQLSVPRELGGPGGDGTNPEQLFAAGFAACFHGALQLVARKEKVDLHDSSITAKVGIGPEGVSYGLEVTLEVALPGVARDQAQALTEAAHQVCPYSKATRGNVEVHLVVLDA